MNKNSFINLLNGLFAVMPCDNSAGSPTPTSFSALTCSTYSLPATNRITLNWVVSGDVVPTGM